MGTKIHAYTSLLYRLVSYRWPFITMGSIFQSAVGSIYGCGSHTYKGLCIMFYFLIVTAFNIFSFILVFSGLDIICLFLLTFILFRYQWIFRSHYYFILFILLENYYCYLFKTLCALFTLSSFYSIPITYMLVQYLFYVCAFSVSSGVSDSLQPHGL